MFYSNNAKYIKTFKFVSWSNFMERYHNLSPDNCGPVSGLKLKYRKITENFSSKCRKKYRNTEKNDGKYKKIKIG